MGNKQTQRRRTLKPPRATGEKPGSYKWGVEDGRSVELIVNQGKGRKMVPSKQ